MDRNGEYAHQYELSNTRSTALLIEYRMLDPIDDSGSVEEDIYPPSQGRVDLEDSSAPVTISGGQIVIHYYSTFLYHIVFNFYCSFAQNQEDQIWLQEHT